MPSERVQRRIDRLLDEAEKALDAQQWALAQSHARQVLAVDTSSEDAGAFLATAEAMLATGQGEGEGAPERQHLPDALPAAARHPSSPALLPQGEKGDILPTAFAAGRYSVKRFLGEGGKKRVYLAHDTTLDRDVAFALIKTDGLDDTARERIAREAQAMGRLGAHPHIVTVFDLGTEPPLPLGEGGGEGTPYMVTELMGGGDVEGAIEQAPEHKLPLPQALAIAEQVCQGLEFAHGKGIVHRDLKPGNVWLTEGIGNRRQGTGGSSPLPGGEGQGEGDTRAGAGARGLGSAVARQCLADV
jgi:Protein kinase domain